MYAFDEFRWIFQERLRRAGFLCENGSLPCISSIQIALKDEDYFDEDYEGDDNVYVLYVEATKTAVLNGIQLPLQIALNASVTAIQRHNSGIVIDIYPGKSETQAKIVFKPNTGDIETGTAEIIAPSK